MSYRRVPSPSHQDTLSSFSDTLTTLNDAPPTLSTEQQERENRPHYTDPQLLPFTHRFRTSFSTSKSTSENNENISLNLLNETNHPASDIFNLPTATSFGHDPSPSSRILLDNPNPFNHSNNPLFNPLLPPLRRLYVFLEDPSSSKYAFYFSIFIGFMIILSCFVATIETIPSLYTNHEDLWIFREGLEIFIIIIFTLEYTLRVIAHSESWSSMWKFILSPLGILDLIAILPYYIESMVYASSLRDQAHMSYVFRTTILKMFRLFRLFRVFKHSSLIQLSIEVLIIALKRSLDALSALFLFIVISLVVFSTLLYFAERGTWDPKRGAFLIDDKPSQFDSIPSSLWFVMVTLTTVGYGDLVPKTFIGKLISFPAMLCGILLIALPSIIVGRNFSLVWEQMRKHNTVIHSPFRTQLPSTGLPSFGPIPETSEDVLKYIHHLGEVIQANQKLLQDAVDKLQVLMLTSTSGST